MTNIQSGLAGDNFILIKSPVKSAIAYYDGNVIKTSLNPDTCRRFCHAKPISFTLFFLSCLVLFLPLTVFFILLDRWFHILYLAAFFITAGPCFFEILKHSNNGNLRRMHGAEHMVINMLEKGTPLNMEGITKESRIHKNCGTSLPAYGIVMFSSLITYQIHPLSLVLIPLIVFFDLNGSRKIGQIAQYFTTAQPTEKELKLALAAGKLILK